MHSPSEIRLFLTIVVVLVIYLFARIVWMIDARGRFFRQADEMVKNRLRERGYFGSINDYNKTVNGYFDSIWGIPMMFLSFWLWNLSKMVRDRQKFNEVATFSKVKS